MELIMIKKMLFTVIIGSITLYVMACGKKESTSLTESQKTLTSFLPEKDAVPGWEQKEKPRFFTADNLWEFIDGAADGYIVYGFQEVITSDYANKTGKQIVVDIYRMKDPLNAYGIYAQERTPAYTFSKIGVEGYISDTILNFWIGEYYIKITVFEKEESLMKDIQNLAGIIARKINYIGGEPAQLAYFPQKNLKPHTIQYIPKDVLGQSYLTNGFEAQYRADKKDYKMTLIQCVTEEAAKDGLAKYKQFLAQNNPETPPKDIKHPGSGGFIGTNSFYGTVVAVYLKNMIIVVLGVPSDKAATDAITECINAMK